MANARLSTERFEHARADFAAGRPIVIVASTTIACHGAIAVAAEDVDADAVNFMVRFGRGIVCLALTAERARALELPQMVPEGEADPDRAAFTVSIEARSGVTTGISTADRARTIRVASDPHSGPHDVSRPGHIFPIVAHPAGVLGRRGLAEAAVDIARFAGRGSAAAFCHVMNDDGSMAGRQELQAFAARHTLPLLTADDVIRARLVSERLVELDSHPELPTAYGRFRIVSTATPLPGPAPLALVLGELDGKSVVPVYFHRACAAGEAFGSLHCECGERLRTALAWIQRWGRGVVVHEPGSTPAAGAAAFGRCAASAPRRDPIADAVAPSLLRRLGVRRVRLLQGSGASDLARLSAWGLEAVEVLSLAGLEAPVRRAREAAG